MTAPGLGKRKPRIRRSWDQATAKLEREGCCRVCGVANGLQRAHIIAREHDKRAPLWGKWDVWTVVEQRIVPLCGPCHRAYDEKRLDLLAYLHPEEQAHAVFDAGGVFAMLARTMASENPRRVA